MKLLSFLLAFILFICMSVVSPIHGPNLASTGSRKSNRVKRRRLSEFVPMVDDPMNPSLLLESQLLKARLTRFDDLPTEFIEMLPLYMHSGLDVMNLAFIRKTVYSLPQVAAIQKIRQFCNVKGDRVFPSLTLAKPPCEECTESIIASTDHFHVQSLNMTGV